MKKRVHVVQFKGPFWPLPDQLAPFFLTINGQQRTYSRGNDNWGLSISGLYGTEAWPTYVQDPEHADSTQVEAHLSLWAHPKLGVLIMYERYGGGLSDTYFTFSDLSRLNQWVETRHGDLRPVGLFIPFRDAWPAVKEFMDTEGELPKCINWVSADDLPAGTFPDPDEQQPIKVD